MRLTALFAMAMLLLCSGRALAQPFVIKGSILDTVNSYTLQHGSVTLLQKSDSTLETFTRTAEDGSFTLLPSAPGKYLIMVTFPSFVDYVDVVEVKDNNPVDLGQIPMVSRVNLLKEVLITKQIAAIKVKGDTLEYVADSFKVRENATVESLLKKLPGIQVDKNGQIVAQGEKVEKILVDGEEFFSDDPAVVSKSLQANVVDKVQVFDKKSDQAAFTGIDDGEKTKTINLQLKENKKKGYFGKVDMGGGKGDERNYFENQAMFNAFKGKRKFSAFGIMSNTGKIGLGWEDRDKFSGDNNNTVVTDDGTMYSYYENDGNDFDSWSGQYNGQGLPRAWTGGLHYSNKWNEDKHHTGANYRYAKQIIETAGNTLTEYNLPDNSKYYTDEKRNILKDGQRNKMDVVYEWKPDSTSSLKLTANASYTDMRNRSDYSTRTFNDTGNINSSTRRVSSDVQTKSVNSSLDWRKKLQKKGRTISLNATQKYRSSESDGFLNAMNNFSNAPATFVDQHKENDGTNLSLQSKLAYTEPLVADKMFLEANYSLKIDNNEARRVTTSKSNAAGEAYDVIDPVLSSNYVFDVLTNAAGLNYRYTHKKINAAIGGSVSRANFTQHDLFADTAAQYGFTNFFPAANFTYKFTKQSRLNLRYNGATEQPSIQQIQPLRDNTDPLNISIGNPYLTQEFNHRIRASYNTYKVLTGRYIWVDGSVNLVDNAISMAQSIDAQGRKTYQYVNVDGNYDAWAYVGYGFKIKKLVRVDLNGNFNVNHSNNIINGQQNISGNNGYTARVSVSYDSDDEKFSVRLSPAVTYNDNRSSVNTLTTSFWNSNNEFEISYEFPKKIEVGTDINWFLRQQTSVFDQNNNVFRWNAYISKKFLKNDQLELKASVYDILNQNIGFSRYAQNNYVYQDQYNTIRRYGMVSLIWNFTKSPLNAPANGGNIIIQD